MRRLTCPIIIETVREVRSVLRMRGVGDRVSDMICEDAFCPLVPAMWLCQHPEFAEPLLVTEQPRHNKRTMWVSAFGFVADTEEVEALAWVSLASNGFTRSNRATVLQGSCVVAVAELVRNSATESWLSSATGVVPSRNRCTEGNTHHENVVHLETDMTSVDRWFADEGRPWSRLWGVPGLLRAPAVWLPEVVGEIRSSLIDEVGGTGAAYRRSSWVHAFGNRVGPSAPILCPAMWGWGEGEAALPPDVYGVSERGWGTRRVTPASVNS